MRRFFLSKNLVPHISGVGGFGIPNRYSTTLTLRDRALLPRNHLIALHHLRLRRHECQALSTQLSSSAIPEIDGEILDRWKRVLDADERPIRGYFSADEESGGIGGQEEEEKEGLWLRKLEDNRDRVKVDRTWGLACSDGLYDPDRTRKFLIAELESCISVLRIEEERVWEEGVRARFGDGDGDEGEGNGGGGDGDSSAGGQSGRKKAHESKSVEGRE